MPCYRMQKLDLKNDLKGRIDAGIFNITLQDLKDIWEHQRGLCYYSYLPLKYDEKCWMMSLERLDPNAGYIKMNTVLSCVEFQHQVQWSNNKINELLNILDNTINDNFMNFELVNKNKKIPISVKKNNN